MLGLMQDWPLVISKIIDYAASQHGSREVVTRSVEGPVTRSDYASVRRRALQVAQRLVREGISPGDRIATLAWNTARHLEAWYGITGAGAIYHTVNPRLFPEQIAWIIDHAQDRIVLVDLTFVPLLEALVLRANDLSGFVARDLSGFMLSLHRGMKHEADRAAPRDSADEIQRGVRRVACWGTDPDGGGATAGNV